MKNVLIVISSVREGRIADKILTQVENAFAGKDVKLDVADFKKSPLPFYDMSVPPSAEGYEPTYPEVKAWQKQVKHADVVVFLTSENNYSYTAALKNAIDWLYMEWTDKPIAFVGYGWSGGSKAITELKNLMTGFIKASPLGTEAQLAFMKDITLEGEPTSDEASQKLTQLVASITE